MIRIFIIFLTISSSLFSQNIENYIKGRVTERSTGKPLPGANIYFNETMIGTTSDISGNFIINKIPAGSYELITSMIGFEIESVRMVFKKRTHIVFDIEMSEKIYDFGTVVVQAEKDNEWEQNLNFFKNIFIGRSKFANGCVIENEIKLEFERDEDRFYVYSYEPLKIVNNSLGYQVNCDLIEFSYSESDNSYKYLIKTFFKNLNSDETGKVKHWNKNRTDAYFGSFQHFLRALSKNNAVKEGFELTLSRTANYIVNIESPDGFGALSDDQIIETDEYGVLKKIVFDDYLRVLYANTNNEDYILSYLKLKGFEATIDENGSLMESMPFQFYGTWALRGVADLLPKDFEPTDIKYP